MNIRILDFRGGYKIFMGGGGAQKIMSAHAHHERKARSPFYHPGLGPA